MARGKPILALAMILGLLTPALPFASASTFVDDTDENFALGTHENTENANDSVRLVPENTSGRFTSRVFDAGMVVDWNILSWTAVEPHLFDRRDNVGSEPLTLIDGASRIGTITGGSISDTLVEDGVYENIAEDNLNYFTFVTAESFAYAKFTPPFEWIPRVSTTDVADGDDVGTWIELPFEFPFWGEPRDNVYVCSNGFLIFESLSPWEMDDCTNSLEELRMRAMIAPFWDDLRTDVAGGIVASPGIYVDNAFDNVVITWETTRFGEEEDSVKFQTILYENGDIRINVNGATGFANFSPTLGISEGDNENFIDITDERSINKSWYFGPFEGIGGTDNFPAARSIDGVYENIYEATSTPPENYRLDIVHLIDGIIIPANSYELQIRYFLEGDNENVILYLYNYSTGSWDNIDNLTENSPTTFTYPIDEDHMDIETGEVMVRYVQPDNDDFRTYLKIDYCAVISWVYALQWEHRIENITTGSDNYVVKIKGYVSGEDESIGVYIWDNANSQWEFINNLTTSMKTITKVIDNIENYLVGDNISIRCLDEQASSPDSGDNVQATLHVDLCVVGENSVATSEIKLRVRVSADGSIWTDNLGPDGTPNTYFTTSFANLENIPDNRYIQYIAHLSSENSELSGGEGPRVLDVRIDYGVVPPIPVSPADGENLNITPTLRWENLAPADNFWLQVDDDPNFLSPDYENENIPGTENSITIPVPLSNEVYHWRIKMRWSGEWSNWSVVRTFRFDTISPSPPSLVWPSDGENIGDNTPNLDWTPVSDASMPVLYYVAVSDNSEFPYENENSGWIGDDNWLAPELPEGVWYWRVRARDNAGNVGDNMIGSFRVDTLVPGLLWPPDGLRTPDNTLTLSWENWRPADNFEVWVDNDSDFSAPEVLENSTENVYALPLELPDGTYYWRVRAYAGATVGPWPMTRNFTIDVPPSAPIHIEGDLEFTPANGVVAGSGTPGDPYIIENWVIDASPTDYGVLIEDTTRHFILRNSTIYEGEWAGVRFEGVLNGRVENVVLSRNGYGIYLLSSDNNVIIDVVSENNREKGIYLSSSDNNTLENSTLRNNGSEFFGGEGISLWSSHRNLISNIVSENNSDGIELDEGSSYNTIENSTFENNRSAGISIDWSHNNVFENNISKNNDWSGIYLYYSNHVILENNLIENNSTGILLRYSENARLSNNRLDNNTYGFGVEGGVFSTFDHDIDNSNLVNGKPIIYLIGENDITINQDNQAGYLGLINCENVRVENLPFENNHQGILLAHASGVSFENNAISSNYYGMYVSGSDNIVIENSVIDNNYYGIQLDSSENFSFENGTITNSSRGFYAVYPRRAKLRNSTFSRNQFGVYLMYGDNSSLENNLFENNFVDIYLYTENTTMRNNQLENSWYDFIVFGYSISNFIHDIDNTNLIDGKPIIYLIGENDFVVSQDNTLGYLGLVNCDNVRVENLMFENTGQPIMLAGTTNSWIENISADNSVAGISLWVSSDNNMILNNAFRYDYYGVYIVGSNGNVLNGNTSENSSYGIYLYNSHNNTLINNRCENNGTGIYLSGADNNLIKNNVCQNNDEGISLSGADNNLIKNNVCQNNSEHDIGCSWSYGNTFEANTYSTFTGIPGISGVAASSVTQSSATIIWTTAAPSNSVVEYGTTTAYGLTSSDASMVTSHSIGLSGLSAGTTYHYRVRSTDGNNNTEISGDYTFTTQAAPPPSPKTNTSLTIDPESFTLASGQSITLTATLVDAENNPLADKTISWNEANDRGSFSVTSATTDENGRASVVYTAPSVTEDENITITASFTGDEVYNGSSGTSRGLISPLPPASTFLAIEPETFDLVSGATLTLVATLTDEDGIPLAGKTIEWSESTSQNGVTWTLPVALGSSVTNSEGRASITYTAREVDVKTRVRITAAFEGDNEYQKSSAVSLGVIIPSEVAEKLEYLIEKLEDRTRELEIEVENEHLEEVGNAFLEDDLGAVISINIVAGVPIIENDYQHPDIEISVEVEIGEIVEVRVSSELPYGKTILVHIDRQTLPVTKLEDLVVLLDGENVGFAVNYGDALDPTDENVPEFLVMFGAEGIQVLVSIPGFTERTITIAVYPTVPIVGFPPLHVVALVAIVLLFAILAVIWRRIGAGAKGVQGV